MWKLYRDLIIGLTVLAMFSCEEIYIGSQPKFLEEQEVEPALNVFGVLRPDSLYGQPASFVLPSVIATTIDDTTSSWIVRDAGVFVSGADTATFYFTSDTFGRSQYMNFNFIPEVSKTYLVTCSKPGYDTVYAYAKIPPKPVVLEYLYSNGEMKVVIQDHPDIFLYDIIIYTENDFAYDRFLPNSLDNKTEISLPVSKPVFFEIYGYDVNLAGYYGSTNVFIKPNTYRKPFSTVENGYGCIGALNKTVVIPE